VQPLTERQEMLLALIIHDYVENAIPVGSKRLTDDYALRVSSATIRNEMSALTSVGLLRQPHTSAGRIPTENGYRYFVRKLLSDTELPNQEKRLIRHQFHQAPAEMDEWVRLAASILAQQSNVASLVTTPRTEQTVLKHLELISTRGRQVLLILVLQGGNVRQHLLTLTEDLSQQQLSQVANQITAAYHGQDAGGLRNRDHTLDLFPQEIIDIVIDIMERADAVSAGLVHHDGFTNMLLQPEFAHSEAAQKALRLLEQHNFLEELLSSALNLQVGGVEVVIGGEGSWTELKDCSMVLARYGAPGYATGALGVLGPTRMAYGRTISTVRYVAGLLSDLVIDAFAQ